MNKKKNRRIKVQGRRMEDKLSPSVLLSTAIVNLSGAPARKLTAYLPAVLALWVVFDKLLKIVREVKGQVTIADISIGVSGALSVNPTSAASPQLSPIVEILLALTILSTIISMVAILYWYRERRLKERIIHELGMHISVLEKYFDPTRTSSGLTRTGRTDPGDE